MKRKRCCQCRKLTHDWATVNGYTACYACWKDFNAKVNYHRERLSEAALCAANARTSNQ